MNVEIIARRTAERDMATDWAADVRKYAPNADDKAIAGIVRYCGIALQKRDLSRVSIGDKEEVARVRSNFLKKEGGRRSLMQNWTRVSLRCRIK